MRIAWASGLRPRHKLAVSFGDVARDKLTVVFQTGQV
jgi:hypothetical protein